jgi:protein-tyrosine-phosphatase/predicted ATP-grasp superfamily ATP-dependent carboligase
LTSSRKALVIGDDTRSFLATVRSLGRQGLEVHVAPNDLGAPALRSKYISRMHRLPYYLDGGELWLTALETVCRRENFDLIVPCEERALLPLYRHREQLEKHCRLAIPDSLGLATFFDKYATRELASSLGVPIARGRLLAPTDTPASICAEFRLPLVIKPRRSYTWRDLYVRKSTAVIKSTAELEQWLFVNREDADQSFLEEFWPGLGGGVSVLCDRGKVLLAFEHQRAHELAGSSYYRRSMPVNRARLEAVAAMTGKIEYTGLAMFEFKINQESSEWRLLEINARPWGSLPLPVALGVDFPYALYRLLVDGARPAATQYRSGVYGRNLIPDLWQLRSTLQDIRAAPVEVLGRVAAWLWEFRRVLAGREVPDLWVRDDRAPALAELRHFLRDRLASVHIPGFASGARDPIAERRRLVAVTRAAVKPLDILFVCQGNICRSPYAELKLKQLIPADSKLRVSSAGMLPRNARPSPPAALEAAASMGIDLSGHRSRHAHQDTVSAATLIFIFDDINLRSFVARYPELRDRVFFLSTLDDAHSGCEIADPEGHDGVVFRQTYANIDRSIENLLETLNGSA